MGISRRTFLASAGTLGVSAAAMSGLGWPGQDALQVLPEWSAHEEQWRVTVCDQCPGGCGVLARVVDGRLVRLIGNPLYPVNRGGLCMKGLAAGQLLYDPDRIRTPLERAGARGEGRWKPIAWDEALDRVAARLGALRSEGGAHRLVVLGGRYRGLIDGMLERFCQAYGTPNYLRLRYLRPERGAPAHYFMQGISDPLVHDLGNARFILSFGCNLLETWQSPVHQQWIYGKLRDRVGGERAQLAQVDPRYSVTAAKADHWIAVRPGTDSVLALGLAYVIIQERLYDRDFVQDHTFGFEDWRGTDGVGHQGFKRLVLEQYSPEMVSAVTGVPVEQLFALGRAFAMNRPALAIGERGPSFHPADIYTRMAVHSLNALVGSIGVPGGIFRQGRLPLAPWPALAPDPAARAGRGRPRIDEGGPTVPGLTEFDISGLPGAIARGEPYRPEVLLVYRSNPLFSQPNRAEWEAALAAVPLVVSFSPFMDETTLHADLVLPDSTFLERWRDDQVTHLAGISLFGIGGPVVPALHATQQTEQVILALARRLGGGVGAAFPWSSFEALLQATVKGLYEADRGHLLLPPQEEAFEAILARQGYWNRQFDSYEAFWDAMLRKGAWWDPNDSFVGVRQLLQTRSGRFEFYAQNLHDALAAPIAPGAAGRAGGEEPPALRFAAAVGLKARGDVLFLPHYEPGDQERESTDFPYYLNTYKLLSQQGTVGANQPWLLQQPAVEVAEGWESWVEIHPQTAGRHGIQDGDRVWLESARGRMQVKARLFPGAQPDVLNMPYGKGHRAIGRWARERGQNPNEVLVAAGDRMRGLPIWGPARVRLRKA